MRYGFCPRLRALRNSFNGSRRRSSSWAAKRRFGEASWHLPTKTAALVKQFESDVATVYREILKSLKRKQPDLAALSRKYQQVLSRDHFHSKLGKQVRDALLAARSEMEK